MKILPSEKMQQAQKVIKKESNNIPVNMHVVNIPNFLKQQKQKIQEIKPRKLEFIPQQKNNINVKKEDEEKKAPTEYNSFNNQNDDTQSRKFENIPSGKQQLYPH